MSTVYTMHKYWVSQKPPMAVKVAMAKEAIKQGLRKDSVRAQEHGRSYGPYGV